MLHARHSIRECRNAAPLTGRSRWAGYVALAGYGLLLGCVGLAPWFYGAIQPGIQVWMFLAVALVMGCWLVHDLLGSPLRNVPTALLPLVVVLGWGVFQMTPLGAKAVAVFSPAAASLRADLVGPVPATAPEGSAVPVAQTISLYPASTRHSVTLLVLATAVFLGGAALCRTPKTRLGLLIFLAVLGGVIAFFDLTQQLLHRSDGAIWRLNWAASGTVFGPLVNRNSAAGLLNLCLAGAIGWIVWNFRPGSDAGTHGHGGWRVQFHLLRHLDGPGIASLGLAAFLVAGVLATMSRGGVLALLAGVVALLVFGVSSRRGTGWVWFAVLPMLVGILILLWSGLGPSVRGRVASLMDERVLAERRLAHWQDALQVVGDYWRAGSGPGTYRFVYPQYQERPDLSWYWHAENQPLEELAEQGIVGLAMLIGMAGLMAVAAGQLIRIDRGRDGYALGMAGVFALVSQSVSLMFDFGLCLPGNLVVVSLLCGVVTGATLFDAPKRWRLSLRWPRPFSVVVPASLAVALVWGASQAHASSQIQAAIKASATLQGVQLADSASLDPSIGRLNELVALYPDEAEAHSHLSKLYIERYRAESLAQLRQEQPKAEAKALAERTSLFVLHARLHELQRRGRDTELETLRATPVVQRNLLPALKHAFLARQNCPLLTTPYRTIAWLSGLIGSADDDARSIAAMRRLLPFHPGWRKECGLLEFNANRFDAAAGDWRVAIKNDPRLVEPILSVAEQAMSWPFIVEQVLPQSPLTLLRLAEDTTRARKSPLLRRLLAERAEAILEDAGLPEAECHYLRGWSLALRGRYVEGIEQYTLAVELRPRDVRWRYRLAMVLKDQGMLQPAYEQALVCTRLAAGDPTYKTLLEQIEQERLHAANHTDR